MNWDSLQLTVKWQGWQLAPPSTRACCPTRKELPVFSVLEKSSCPIWRNFKHLGFSFVSKGIIDHDRKTDWCNFNTVCVGAMTKGDGLTGQSNRYSQPMVLTERTRSWIWVDEMRFLCSVLDLSNQKEALGKTHDMLEGLGLLAILRTAWDPPGEAGGRV